LYLFQPCLLSLALFVWAFGDRERDLSRRMILVSLLSLSLSEVEMEGTGLSVYPAGLVLLVPFLSDVHRRGSWPEVLIAAFFGGLLCWRVADAIPLQPGLLLLCAMLLSAPVCLICRERAEAQLALGLGSLFFELFFCLREYMLFSFCVIRLGSREGLSLASLSMLLFELCSQAYSLLFRRQRGAVFIEF